VAAAFFAAARRFLVAAAFFPAARRFRVVAAFLAVARRFRVCAAFFAPDAMSRLLENEWSRVASCCEPAFLFT